MSGVVAFDPAAFKTEYPAFASVSDARLSFHFDTATLYLDNTVASVVADLTRRAALLNLLVAHLAQLSGDALPGGAGSSAGKVGRVASASEGSVSASFAMEGTGARSSWYMQTQYGAMYWNATAPYRRGRYVPPSRC